MFVKFRRPYFSKDAVRYEPRIWVELGDDMRDVLPSDAEVSDTLPGGATEMPDRGPKAIPGFGAQPQYEQELALIGANETHLMSQATGENPRAKTEDTEVPKPTKPSMPVMTSVPPKSDDKSNLTRDLTDKKK